MWGRSAVILLLVVLLVGCGGDEIASTVATTGAPNPDVGLVWARTPCDEAVFGGVNTTITSMTVGGPGLVAVGAMEAGEANATSPAVWVSADGSSWTRVDDEAFSVEGGGGYGALVISVTRGGPGLVAVGTVPSDGGTDGAVWVSADGYTWTRVEDEAVFGGAGSQWVLSVTAGGPGLVAVGYEEGVGTGADPVVWVSADAYSWTRLDEPVSDSPDSQQLHSVTAGGPGLVAVGDHLSDSRGWDAAVWLSPDGYTWTRIEDQVAFSGPQQDEGLAVVAGGPGLVAVGWATGDDGATDAAVWVSADGYAWTRIEDEVVFGGPGGQDISSVVVGGPGLVAVGGEQPADAEDWDTRAVVWVSADGYTWTRAPHDEAVFGGPGFQAIRSVVATGSGLVATGSNWSEDYAGVAVWVSPPPG